MTPKWRRVALVCALCAAGALAQDGPGAKTPFERHFQAAIPLACSLRAPDIALSPDGSRAWLCSDYPAKAVFSLDAHSGRFTGQGWGLSGPSVIYCHPADGRLYVVDEMPEGWGRGALVHVFSPDAAHFQEPILVKDWRCYRVGSAAFSADANWL